MAKSKTKKKALARLRNAAATASAVAAPPQGPTPSHIKSKKMSRQEKRHAHRQKRRVDAFLATTGTLTSEEFNKRKRMDSQASDESSDDDDEPPELVPIAKQGTHNIAVDQQLPTQRTKLVASPELKAGKRTKRAKRAVNAEATDKINDVQTDQFSSLDGVDAQTTTITTTTTMTLTTATSSTTLELESMSTTSLETQESVVNSKSVYEHLQKSTNAVEKRKVDYDEGTIPANMIKYWYQRHNYFSKFDDGIHMDLEGWYSVTPELVAIHIAERCACDVIIDAFCGVGGNAIQFAQTCHRVIAIDIDQGRLDCARHNAKIYGVEDRIEFICGDFMTLIPRLKADVVFLSPPWGGPEYLKRDKFDVKADIPMDGEFLFQETSKITPNIAYFLPRNSDPEQIGALVKDGTSCEIEQNYLNGRCKAWTAYFSELAVVEATTYEAVEGDEAKGEDWYGAMADYEATSTVNSHFSYNYNEDEYQKKKGKKRNKNKNKNTGQSQASQPEESAPIE